MPCIGLNVYRYFNILFVYFSSRFKGFIEVSNLNITFGSKVREHQWIEIVKHYWAILLLLFIAALLIVLMPIIG